MPARATVRREQIRPFADAATRFCSLIEGRSRISKRQFVIRCPESLAELQLQSLRLLAVKTASIPDSSADRMTHDQWQRLYKALAKKLGEDNDYYLVFNPYNPESDDPVFRSLSDDLADI